MAKLYVKNKYTPIVLIALGLTFFYIFLVLYYIQMVDSYVDQYSLSLQKEGYSVEQADHNAEEKYGLIAKDRELTVNRED
jgi:hypothetical protein